MTPIVTYEYGSKCNKPLIAYGSDKHMNSGRRAVSQMEGRNLNDEFHSDDVIMGTIASQITSLTIVFSTVYLDADQRKHQSSASLAFVRGIHRRPVNSPHKWPVTRKMFPFDDVIMYTMLKVTIYLVALLQTWIDFNPSMDKWLRS